MKHTRSSAERETRDAFVAHFREHEPRARIVHEINVGTVMNRADLGIVFPDMRVLVEIKSAKDKLSRLEAQFDAFQRYSHMALIVERARNAKKISFRGGGDHPRKSSPTRGVILLPKP